MHNRCLRQDRQELVEVSVDHEYRKAIALGSDLADQVKERLATVEPAGKGQLARCKESISCQLLAIVRPVLSLPLEMVEKKVVFSGAGKLRMGVEHEAEHRRPGTKRTEYNDAA
jgi:hypothetical protein